MKTILTKLLGISGIALLMLTSCKKDGKLVTSNGGQAGTLSASVTTLPLDKAKVSDPSTVINFSFTSANYGFSAAVTNTLQIDVPSDNWKNPASSTLGLNVNSQGYSTADFNNLVLKLNVPAGVATPIAVRVMHSISVNVPPIYSNVLSLTVTAFNLTSWVYVPGSYEGWGNPGAQEDSLISPTGNGVYSGIINFPAGDRDFLIVPVKGSWANKWATTDGETSGSTSATYSTQYVTGGDNNFFAPSTPGYYLVTLNTNTNQISIVQADSYSVIGDGAQGWNPGNDVPMKFINDGNNTWTVTTALVSTGSIKIRQDDAWTWSWGIPNSGSAGAGVPSTLNDTSNGNIPVPASGNYNVSFIMAATPNGTTPAVTTTYTLTKQ